MAVSSAVVRISGGVADRGYVNRQTFKAYFSSLDFILRHIHVYFIIVMIIIITIIIIIIIIIRSCRIHSVHMMRAIATDRVASFAFLCVCWLRSWALKTAKPIEMPFGGWLTRVQENMY